MTSESIRKELGASDFFGANEGPCGEHVGAERECSVRAIQHGRRMHCPVGDGAGRLLCKAAGLCWRETAFNALGDLVGCIYWSRFDNSVFRYSKGRVNPGFSSIKLGFVNLCRVNSSKLVNQAELNVSSVIGQWLWPGSEKRGLKCGSCLLKMIARQRRASS